MAELSEKIREMFRLEERDITSYSALSLAYLGDAVFELVVRTVLVERYTTQVKKYHDEATKLVSCKGQREILKRIEPLLTETEKSYFRRGRNSKPHSVSKSGTIADYTNATGFESLCGHLYVTNQTERLIELVKYGIEKQDGNSAEGGN
ncbi:MAG: ribonuclease III [Lachnospiraceae bacterium]|nr:ribonuclease III [Lachnospiraceae bacterium]